MFRRRFKGCAMFRLVLCAICVHILLRSNRGRGGYCSLLLGYMRTADRCLVFDIFGGGHRHKGKRIIGDNIHYQRFIILKPRGASLRDPYYYLFFLVCLQHDHRPRRLVAQNPDNNVRTSGRYYY